MNHGFQQRITDSARTFPYLDTWLWPAFAIGDVDGDTFDVHVDRVFHDASKKRIRLYGVDTPERGEPGYHEATAGLHAIVFDVAGGNAPFPLLVRTVLEQEKYGRWLAAVQVVGGVADVSTELVRLGLGVEYYGGTR